MGSAAMHAYFEKNKVPSMLGKTRNKSISLSKNNTELVGAVTIQDMVFHQHSAAVVQNESTNSRKDPTKTKS